VPQDPAEALKWYRTAAELGDADAQGRIAFLLATGPEPKYAEAAKWFKTSAERGHEQAVYWMGRFSEEGWGVPKDPKVAARLYQEAAIAGDPDAQYRLGVLQREGRGVERDAKRAQMWVLRAAMQGNAEAETLYKAEYQPKPKTPAYPDKLPPGVYQAPGGSAPGPASSAPPLPPGLNLPTGQIPAGAKAQ
jgi:TPR repeat protein